MERPDRPPARGRHPGRGRVETWLWASASPATTACPSPIRGGGHSVAGNGTADGGLVIDLRPHARRERGPRDTLGPCAGRSHAGRPRPGHDGARRSSCPAGVVSGTGVGGLTLGGGMGWLTRAHGLTIDHLVGAHIVAADGRAGARQRDRGARALLGPARRRRQLRRRDRVRVPRPASAREVLAGATFYRRERWAAALRLLCRVGADDPRRPDHDRDVHDAARRMAAAGAPGPAHAAALVLLGRAWTWPRASEPWPTSSRPTRHPTTLAAEPTPWLDLQSSADDGFPRGAHAYFKSTFFDELDGDAIATLVEHAGRRSSRLAGTDIHQLGGRYARVPAEATAFGRRDARYILNIWGVWTDAADDAREIALGARLLVGHAASRQRRPLRQLPGPRGGPGAARADSRAPTRPRPGIASSRSSSAGIPTTSSASITTSRPAAERRAARGSGQWLAGAPVRTSSTMWALR